MKKVKNFVILSLVSFLLGGTIYFSLTVQDQPQDEPAVKGVETSRPSDSNSDNGNTLAYINPPGVEVQEPQVTVSISSALSPTVVATVTTKPMSPTPTFGTKYENTAITSLPSATPTIKQLPTQANANPNVTLPVAGAGDYVGKIAAGAGLLIIASFLL